jgi:hypothetical protein
MRIFKTIFLALTAFIAFAQVYAIYGNFTGGVHGQTIWMIIPITVLCFGVLAIIEAIENRMR